jgi:N-carbamoyl-L-amino-acid hydrolase
MAVDSERLKRRFDRLSEIGKTEGGGVSRLALSDEDKEARDLFVSWLKELGLEVKVDDLGNIYGILKGKNPDAAPLVMGSHLDSVPRGGKYDGTIGVLAGLEAIESLIEDGIEPDQPVIVVNFTNEEGARFPKPMISSGVLSGKFTTEDMYKLEDDNGISIEEELKRIGYLGDRENRLQEADKFFEVHIEQGPVLIDKGVNTGIVEGIQGLSWHQITYTGETDHAGPSPMEYRRDAGVGAVTAMSRLYKWVKKMNDETLITFGKIKASPGAVNVIPGEVTFSIDIRHPDKGVLEERIEQMKQTLLDTALEMKLDSQIEDLSYMPPVSFSEKLTNDLENICKNKGIPYHRMFSGAGHDAMYMNKLAETVMIFIPSIGGKSHNEAEESRWEDVALSTDLLYELVKQQVSSGSRVK